MRTLETFYLTSIILALALSCTCNANINAIDSKGTHKYVANESKNIHLINLFSTYFFFNFLSQITDMKLSLIGKVSRNSSPKVVVTFPDGYSDIMVLQKHKFDGKFEDQFKEQDGDDDIDCNYFGHLSNESDACVAMTGCIGSEDVVFSIMSRHAEKSSHFAWFKNGHVQPIELDLPIVRLYC